jgi:hypothetical protein
VVAGASTNDGLIPGSANALTFKTMADALVLRSHLTDASISASAQKTNEISVPVAVTVFPEEGLSSPRDVGPARLPQSDLLSRSG